MDVACLLEKMGGSQAGQDTMASAFTDVYHAREILYGNSLEALEAHEDEARVECIGNPEQTYLIHLAIRLSLVTGLNLFRIPYPDAQEFFKKILAWTTI